MKNKNFHVDHRVRRLDDLSSMGTILDVRNDITGLELLVRWDNDDSTSWVCQSDICYAFERGDRIGRRWRNDERDDFQDEGRVISIASDSRFEVLPVNPDGLYLVVAWDDDSDDGSYRVNVRGDLWELLDLISRGDEVEEEQVEEEVPYYLPPRRSRTSELNEAFELFHDKSGPYGRRGSF